MSGNNTNRSLLALAIGSAMGALHAPSAQAVGTVTDWDLRDFDNDGAVSGFSFVPAPSPDGLNGATFGTANETGCWYASDRVVCDPIVFDAGPIRDRVFTTGFNFYGTGAARPAITGDISAVIGGGAPQSLVFTALDFGVIYYGARIFLAPDSLQNCTGAPGCGARGGTGPAADGFGYNVSKLVDLGNGRYGVVVEFASTVDDPLNPFHNFTTQWRIEGVMNTGGAAVPGVEVRMEVAGGTRHECAEPGGDTISFSASTVLFGGADLAGISWTLDGAPVAQGASVDLFVPLGRHEVGVTAETVGGASDFTVENVLVQDTTPPDIDVSFIDSRSGAPISQVSGRKSSKVEIHLHASDACDPEPVVQGVAGFPVEDGNRIKVKPKKSRVRIETSSLDLMGTATDASGNTAVGEATLTIVSPPDDDDDDDDDRRDDDRHDDDPYHSDDRHSSAVNLNTTVVASLAPAAQRISGMLDLALRGQRDRNAGT